MFYELNAAAIQSAARGVDDTHGLGASGSGGGDGGDGSGAPAGGCVFKTSEERAMLVALLLHCADISNASKPRHIAEKCAWRASAVMEACTALAMCTQLYHSHVPSVRAWPASTETQAVIL